MVDEAKTTEPVVIRSRQAWQLIALGVIILASGIVIGSGATMLCLKDRTVRTKKYEGKQHLQIVKKMQSDYKLSKEQSGQLEEVFKKRFASTQAIRQESRQKIDAERKELVASVKEVLTQEQFDKWLKEFKAREKKSRDRRRQRQKGQGERRKRERNGPGNGKPQPREPGGAGRPGGPVDHDAPMDRH